LGGIAAKNSQSYSFAKKRSTTQTRKNDRWGQIGFKIWKEYPPRSSRNSVWHGPVILKQKGTKNSKSCYTITRGIILHGKGGGARKLKYGERGKDGLEKKKKGTISGKGLCSIYVGTIGHVTSLQERDREGNDLSREGNTVFQFLEEGESFR